MPCWFGFDLLGFDLWGVVWFAGVGLLVIRRSGFDGGGCGCLLVSLGVLGLVGCMYLVVGEFVDFWLGCWFVFGIGC